MFLPALIAASLAASLVAPPTPPTPQAAPPASPTAPTPAKAFVQADVLRVRSEPRADAPIVARLRIGTPVNLLEPRGTWVRVAVTGGGYDGWVLTSLLDERALPLDEAMAKAASATGPERISWLERSVAIAPGRAGTWRALAEALEKAGLKDRARTARAMLGGEQPGFLTACGGGSAVLLAEWRPGEAHRPLTAECGFPEPPEQGPLPPDCARLRREQERLAVELPSAAWFRFDGSMLPGSPFSRAEPSREGDELTPTRLSLFMGHCDDQPEPWIATTTPLEPLETKSGSLEPRMAAALAALGVVKKITRADVRIIGGSPTITEVRFEGVSAAEDDALHPETGAPIAVKRHLVGWALFSAGAEPVLFEELARDDPGVRTPGLGRRTLAEIGTSSWSRLALQPGVRVAAIPWSAATGFGDPLPHGSETVDEGGFWIVTIDADGRARMDPGDRTWRSWPFNVPAFWSLPQRSR